MSRMFISPDRLSEFEAHATQAEAETARAAKPEPDQWAVAALCTVSGGEVTQHGFVLKPFPPDAA